MPSYTQRESGECCEDPEYEEDGLWNEGERVEAYVICENCGAEFRDVFTYSYTEQKD